EARRGRRVRPHPQRLPLPRRAHGGARARRGRGLARLRRAPRARLRRPHPVRGRGPRLRVPEARGQPGAAHGGHPHELRRITVSSQIAHRPSRHSESGPGPARAGPGGAVPHPSATATVRFVSPAPEPRLVARGDELDGLVRELLSADLYAIDTEFHRERTYLPRVALVQVAWAGGVALIDAMAVDLAPLAQVLAEAGEAVAHAAEQDLEVLLHACGAVPSRLFY